MRRRYGSKLRGLRAVFSEYGLIRLRVLVECRWMQHLAGMPEITEVPSLDAPAQQLLDQLATAFGVQDAQEVKDVSLFLLALACERKANAEWLMSSRWSASPTTM